MRPVALAVVLALAVTVPVAPARAQSAPDSVALVKLLNEFLAGAGRDDRAVHEKFWADEPV